MLIYRLCAEMNWRWMLLVTPRLSCRTELGWKVSSLESFAFLKWKMLVDFPEMHSASLFQVCQGAYLYGLCPYSITFFPTSPEDKAVLGQQGDNREPFSGEDMGMS